MPQSEQMLQGEWMLQSGQMPRGGQMPKNVQNCQTAEAVRGSECRIRRMTPEDAAAAAALERECFSEPWSENAYLGTLADENALYLAAEREDGTLAGICGVLNILGEGDISNVAVAQPFRRRKIAERMLEELLRQGRENGITAFTLEVRASNEAAVRLYEKFGFVQEGRRRNFYKKPVEDALILWKR